MNQVLIKSAQVVLVLWFVSWQAAGAESLEAAWAVALGQDLALQASRDQVSAAEEELAAAKARRMPTLTASAAVTRFNEEPAFDFSTAAGSVALPFFGNENMETADARVTLPLYTGGALSHGIDAARARLSARASQSNASTQQTKLTVAQHYINVLRAERALAVAESTVKSLEAHVADVDDMFKSGAVARNDYLSAAVSLADSRQRHLLARNSLDLASAAYNRALGRSLDAPVDLDENLPGIDPQLETNSLESLSALALAGRDELSGLQAAADAYKSQSEATRSQTRPRLALTGGYTSMQNEVLNRDDFWMVGVGVEWNLFDGGQSRKKASALSYRARALSRERKDLESMIELQVRQSWLRLQETRERMRLTASAVEQAEENLRVVRDRYRNGEGTNTEVLDAETLRSLSRSNFDNAEFDASLALYELARGVGRL